MFIGTLITMALGLVLWIPYGPGHPDLQNVGMEICCYVFTNSQCWKLNRM